MPKEKKDSKGKVFNFGDSPLVKQTEQAVTEGYQSIEEKEKGHSQSLRPSVVPTEAPRPTAEPTQNINVPIPVSLHQRLKMISVTKRQNMKDLVALAIREYVERQG